MLEIALIGELSRAGRGIRCTENVSDKKGIYNKSGTTKEKIKVVRFSLENVFSIPWSYLCNMQYPCHRSCYKP